MKKIIYFIAILLGLIAITSIQSCSSIDEDYLDCPTCPNGKIEKNDTTVIVNGNDTVFIYSNKTVVISDTLTSVRRDTSYFETNDPSVTELIDTTKSEVLDEYVVNGVLKNFVEPDSLFITNVDSIFRTVYIDLNIHHKIPILVDPPVEGADITIYLNLYMFDNAYGQIETNGDKYLNFYGNGRGAHIKMSDLSIVLDGSNVMIKENALPEAERHGYDGIDENLYYDHVRSIWMWVFNKDTQTFIVEMNGVSWTTSSAKDRFFSLEYTLEKYGKQLWMEIGGKKVCFVAKRTEN